MNSARRSRFIFIPAALAHAVLFVLSLLAAADHCVAATIAKNNTGGAGQLDLTNAWIGGTVPGTNDIAAFGSNNTASSGSLNIGNGVSFLGIVATNNPGTGITISNSSTNSSSVITLGSAGIDWSQAQTNRALTINALLSLTGDQTWRTGLGLANSAQISATSVIAGSGRLTVEGSPGATNAFVFLGGPNTFSGGFVLAAGGAVRVGTNNAVVSGGAVTTGAFGSGPFTINGGTIFGHSGLAGSSYTTINADFAINRGAAGGANARLRLFGAFDMAAAERTISLGRYTNSAAATITSGNESLKFETASNGPATTFTNGRLRFVREATGGADDYVGVRFESGTGIFNGGSGFTVGSNVITALPSDYTFTNTGSRPHVRVEAGGYFNLSDNANARGASIRTLGGDGTVTSLASTASNSTLTILPQSGESETFVGRIVDGSSLTNLVAGAAATMSLTINGAGVQTLTGANTYSGATIISAGTLILAGGTNASAASTASIRIDPQGALLLATSGQVNDAAAITLAGGTIRCAAGVSEIFGALVVTADSTVDFGNGAGGTITFGTYAPTNRLTIANFNEGDRLVFRSDLTTQITNASLFKFASGAQGNYVWNVQSGTFTVEAAAAVAVEVTASNTVKGPVPSLIGYNLGAFYPGGNAADWWRYSGVNAARMFLNPVNFPLLGNDGITNTAGFLAAKNALRNDPDNAAALNWPAVLDAFANTDISGAGYTADYAIGSLHDLGVDMLMQITASVDRLPIADANDWGGKWQLWKHYYAMAYYLGRRFDVSRYEMFNEPDHPNAGGLQPDVWLSRLQLVADAVKSAVTDVNRIHGKTLVPLVYAPTTASSTYTTAWGGLAVTNRYVNYLGVTDTSARIFDRYDYHQYGSSPASFGSRVGEIRTALQSAMTPETALPLALTEFNVHTASEFGSMSETLDSPDKFARFGAIVAQLADNGLQEMFAFKFTQTENTNNIYGLSKNGMHYADLTNAPYNQGGATSAAEAWRLFNKACRPGSDMLTWSMNGDSTRPTVLITRESSSGRYHVYSANNTGMPVDLSVDCSAWGLPGNAQVVLEEVSAANNGGIVAMPAVSTGRIPTRRQPPQSVWLYSVDANPAQVQTLAAAADTVVKDGVNRFTTFDSTAPLLAAIGADSSDKRSAAALRFQLPLFYPPDLLCAVLTVQAATEGPDLPAQAHVYGIADNSWTESSASWVTLPALRQNIPAGNRIRNNVVNNTSGQAQIQGQLITAGNQAEQSSLDVTSFVTGLPQNSSVSFLVSQDARWDVALPSMTTGDDHTGGVRIVSREEAGGSGTAPQLLLVRRTDSDNDGLSDTAEQNVFGSSSASADTDGDGLTDGEESLVHGTNPSKADTDGDRQNDRAELLLGTNPRDRFSVWSSRGEMSGASFTLRWQGAAGLTFRVRRSPDLPLGWTTIHTAGGQSGPMSYTDPGPLSGRGFYRVEAE